jgi:hypothetical protein
MREVLFSLFSGVKPVFRFGIQFWNPAFMTLDTHIGVSLKNFSHN